MTTSPSIQSPLREKLLNEKKSQCSPMSHKRLEQLHSEKLRKLSPKSKSPISRKEFLEQEELKECSFAPSINSTSRSIASLKSRSQLSANESLYSEAASLMYKKQLAIKNVILLNYLKVSRVLLNSIG